MLILLEGNECNYKSTIAEKLSKEIGYDIKKGSSFEMAKGTNEALYESFKEMANWESTIVDRFIYSNRVYATVYDGYTILTDEQYEDIQERIKEKAIVIYLYADEEVLAERMGIRGDEYVEADMLGIINGQYDEVMPKSKVYTYGINTALSSSDECVVAIMGVVAEILRRKYQNGGSYVDVAQGKSVAEPLETTND